MLTAFVTIGLTRTINLEYIYIFLLSWANYCVQYNKGTTCIKSLATQTQTSSHERNRAGTWNFAAPAVIHLYYLFLSSHPFTSSSSFLSSSSIFVIFSLISDSEIDRVVCQRFSHSLFLFDLKTTFWSLVKNFTEKIKIKEFEKLSVAALVLLSFLIIQIKITDTGLKGQIIVLQSERV